MGSVRLECAKWLDLATPHPASMLTAEERVLVHAFARDPKAIRESARAYFEGLHEVVCPHER